MVVKPSRDRHHWGIAHQISLGASSEFPFALSVEETQHKIFHQICPLWLILVGSASSRFRLATTNTVL
ncbi:hypothetical protein ABF638_25635 [Nostoc sp. CALU 1950]